MVEVARKKNGQAMLEYLLAFAAMCLLAGAAELCLKAVRRHAVRSVELAAGEYP